MVHSTASVSTVMHYQLWKVKKSVVVVVPCGMTYWSNVLKHLRFKESLSVIVAMFIRSRQLTTSLMDHFIRLPGEEQEGLHQQQYSFLMEKS